ncbi:MAG: AAA family ATPase [Rubrobacteraceae bacterium]
MDSATDIITHAPDLLEVKRILVIGSGGARKSTLSLRLGEILGIEVVHLDTLYWRPGWREGSRLEWEETVRRRAGRRDWIMDGNYGGTLDLRLARADAVILLDLPRSLCIRRVLLRRLRYAHRSRPDMAPGCPERLDLKFLRYLWKYPTERRPGILRKLEQVSIEKTVIVLRSPDEIARFVAEMERSGA